MFEFERIQRIIFELRSKITKNIYPVDHLILTEEKNQRKYKSGTYFGKKNTNYTLSGEVIIPEEKKAETFDLVAYSSLTEQDNSTNPQIKVYLNDQFVQGLDVNHKSLRLSNEQVEQGHLSLRLEIFSGREEKQFPMTVSLREIDPLTEKLYYDFFVLLDSWRSLDKNDPNYRIYEKDLGKAVNFLNFFEPYSKNYYEGLSKAKKLLNQSFYDQKLDNAPVVYAVGHTHIDLAWLWTMMQAVEKGERSYTTVLHFMQEFEDYTFINSQPQMYQFIKERYPELYQKIKEKIVEGKWIPEGAMWVEADCNLTSGESLVRQIFYGKKFFQDEFGIDSKILWLPDVFGYSAALPQLLNKSHVPYFMTTKLSWNQYNQIPYDSFYWQGIDGSRTLTHFITTTSEGYSPTPHYTTYNGILDPYTIKKSWERYLDKDANDAILLAYGYGDGGGGPTREMLEVLKRMKTALPSMPQVKASTGLDFFDELKTNMKNHPEKEWLGELYFEFHRGTYTSIAKNKKNNRRAENMLQSIEKLYSIESLNNYPQALLEKLWKLVLKNQFHDIIPGSAIQEVYDQTDKEYLEVFQESQELIETVLSNDKNSDNLYVFNPAGVARNEIIEVPLGHTEAFQEKTILVQNTHDGKKLARFTELPSLSGQRFPIKSTLSEVAFKVMSLGEKYETNEFIIQFDSQYRMVSVYDKIHQRELAKAGKAFNELIVYEDLPMSYDAWNVEAYYREKPTLITEVTKALVVEKGPIRDTLKIERTFCQSKITQLIHFIHGTTQINFETTVDWHEQHSLLRAEFPVPVNAYEATYDIQFGNVSRPVHHNTSWDQARFEVCGQRWADLSDNSFGVALLTDSKYGFDAQYQHLGLSLLRGPKDPYEKADQGVHEFTYSIYSHEGNWRQGEVNRHAVELNVPCLVSRNDDPRSFTGSWVSSDKRNIYLDTLKKAEKEETLILRGYEFENMTCETVLTFAQPIKSVKVCDLLENETEILAMVDDRHVKVRFAPYEIQTLKIELG